jgi:hypothetical protein
MTYFNVMETGAQGEEFRKLPFRDLRLKYTELSGLECRSKNREWIVGKCVQMKLYGTHEALGKRTLKAAVVGREVNVTLSNNTLLNEEGEESMYHYNPKHVKTIINNQYNNATAGGGGGGGGGMVYFQEDLLYGDGENLNENGRKVLRTFLSLERKKGQNNLTRKQEMKKLRSATSHPLLKHETWTIDKIDKILESFLDEEFNDDEHKIVMMRVAKGVVTMKKEKMQEPGRGDGFTVNVARGICRFALRMATKNLLRNQNELSKQYFKLFIVVSALSIEDFPVREEEGGEEVGRDNEAAAQQPPQSTTTNSGSCKMNACEFVSKCVRDELALSPTLAKLLLKRPKGFRDSFYDDRDKIWPAILFGICASEEVSKEIRDESWIQFQKNARCLKEEDFVALMTNTFAMNASISEKYNSIYVDERSKRYFLNECVAHVQRKGSQEVSASLIRVVFQIWPEYRREILEILGRECAKMIGNSNSSHGINGNDNTQSTGKTAWLSALEAVSTSCELTRNEVDANRSMLLQMLSHFKASRDFGNPVAKRFVFAMNRLFVKSNFFEGKKEAKRLIKDIYANANELDEEDESMIPVLSLLDAERSIKTSSALRIIDVILGENEAAKLELEDVKSDAIETLCASLKRIAPPTDAEALSSSSLISKCGTLAIQSLQKYWPGLDFSREGRTADQVHADSANTTIDEVRMAFKLLLASLEASFNTATACDTSALKMNYLSSFIMNSIDAHILAQGAREAVQTVYLSQRDPRDRYNVEKTEQKKLQMIEIAGKMYPIGSLVATLSYGLYHQMKRHELHQLNEEWGLDKEWFTLVPDIVRLMEFLLPLAMRESSDLWLHQIVRSGVILNDQILTRHMEDIEDRSVLSMTSMMIKFEKLEFGSAECILTVSEMLSMIGSSTRISSKDVRMKISVLKILAKSLVSELPLLPSWDELSSSSSSLNKKNNRVSVVDAVVESASALGETVEIFIPFVVDEWKKLKEEDDNDDKNASSSLLLDIRLLAESLFMASKYCLECCQRAALFLTNSEKKKGDLSAIVLSGARLHYATGSVLEFFQEDVIEAIPVRNAEALELTRRAFMSQCAAVHANLKALKKMKLLDRSLVTLLYALKVHKNTSIADQQTADVEDTEEDVDGKIINERKRKYGFSIYTTTTQAKDALQLNDATHPLDGGKESGADGDGTGGEGKKNEANDDGNGESQQQKRRKVLRKKRSKKRRNRFNNPYLEAVREHEGDDSGDDDDDLADFIVCKPGRDYRQVFGLT